MSALPVRITALSLLLASSFHPARAQEAAPRLPEITVLVLEDAWRVGDEKTYTLSFDRAPFGRQAMRLVSARNLPGGERELVFQQRIRLDLRALGQEGSLEQTGTIVYRHDALGAYRYQEVLLQDHGYATYRTPRDYEASLTVEMDLDRSSYRVGDDLETATPKPLPAPAGGILVDLLAVGHWENVFTLKTRWPLQSRSALPLLVPTDPPRFDFHIPVDGPRAVKPQNVPATLFIEAMEEIDLFGARVEAFRCLIDPLGMTLWVSPNGGILRFSDGRGLTGTLEP